MTDAVALTPSWQKDPLSEISSVRFTFQDRPRPIKAEARIIWRVPLLVFLLRTCCLGNRSSVKRMHVLNWGIRSKKSQDVLLAALEGKRKPSSVLVRLDPLLNRAIDFALGEGLIALLPNGRLQLTPKGLSISTAISASPDCYLQERHFVNRVGRLITEAWVNDVVLFRVSKVRS